MMNQFANEDNWKAHYKTTGPEIWNDTKGTLERGVIVSIICDRGDRYLSSDLFG